jgi:predicted small secreted protein
MWNIGRLAIALLKEAPMSKVFGKKILSLAIVAGALMVSACNTVEGMGKDVSSAGKTVAKTADDSK